MIFSLTADIFSIKYFCFYSNISFWCIIRHFSYGFVNLHFILPQIFKSNPRYILFIHLVINDVMLLFLSTLLHIISYALYKLNTSICIVMLIISIITTQNTPLNLACMAVERYIAICIPLRHGQICTVRRTYSLISLIWVVSAFFIMPDFFFILATEPLQFFHSKVFCARDYVFRSPYSLKKRDASHIICLVLVWLALVYTYAKILSAAKGATVDTKKARSTILLHGFQLLLCMLVYVRSMFEQALLYFLPQKVLDIRFASYVFIHIMPRFISPIVYGMRDKTFRKYMMKYLLCKNEFSHCN